MGKQRIAFIGVGLMGHSMARHLLAAGFPLVVHDIDPVRVEAMVKLGAATAGAPDRIPSQVDVIMLDLGARLNCPLPMISLHAQALASEVSKGRAEWDSADIISFYNELANLE